jgi:hypothetical protein
MTTKNRLITEMKEQLKPVAERALARSGQDIRPLLEASIGVAMVKQALKNHPVELPLVEIEKLDHVADWLSASVARDIPWLRNLSKDGLPKKFSKFHRVDDVLAEADAQIAQMTKTAVREADADDGVKIDVRFDDGWHIAELMSKNALIDEGNAMRHCVGAGNYDAGVRDGTTRIFSFRDGKGKPHVTMEYSVAENRLVQIKGKQNDFPLGRYFDRLVPWIRNNGFTASDRELSGGYFVSQDDPSRIRHIRDLSQDETIEGSLWLRIGGDMTGAIHLPPGLRVSQELRIESEEGAGQAVLTIGAGVRSGRTVLRNVVIHDLDNLETDDLGVYGSRIVKGSGPKTFRAGTFVYSDLGNLLERASFHDLKVRGVPSFHIPGDRHLATNINLWDSNEVIVEGGPNGMEELSVEGNIELNARDRTLVVIHSGAALGRLVVDSARVRIGEDTSVKASMTLSQVQIERPPDRLTVKNLALKDVRGLPAVPDGWRIDGKVKITGGDTVSLGKRNEYSELEITESSIKSLPENLIVRGNLNMAICDVRSLPDGTTVGGKLFARGSLLEHLGDGTSIGGSIDIGRTRIASLPRGLTVKGNLTLDDNQRLRLDAPVSVAGKLTVRSMDAAHCLGMIKANSYDLRAAMVSDFAGVTQIDGDLDISSEALAVLPDGFSVPGALTIRGRLSHEQRLPENLDVGGDLKFEYAPDFGIPAGWKVYGRVFEGDTVIGRSTASSVHTMPATGIGRPFG